MKMSVREHRPMKQMKLLQTHRAFKTRRRRGTGAHSRFTEGLEQSSGHESFRKSAMDEALPTYHAGQSQDTANRDRHPSQGTSALGFEQLTFKGAEQSVERTNRYRASKDNGRLALR